MIKWLRTIVAGSLFLAASVQAEPYVLTVDNQAANFVLVKEICNGGKIKNPPPTLPISQLAYIDVISDASLGCVLNYAESNKNNSLGIWIHEGKVECNNEGTIGAYQCNFNTSNKTLTIKK